MIAVYAAVFVFALAVRLLFHPGHLGSMEMSAARPAIRITEGDLTPTSFATYRYGLVYPIALSFAAFGVGLYSLTLYNLLCSMGMVALAYPIGRRYGGPAVGLGAMVALAVLPLDIRLAGSALPDEPQAFYATLGLWLILIAEERGRRSGTILGLLSGIAFGVSYLCKLTTLFLGPVAVGYAVLKKTARVPVASCLVGLALAGAFECTFNWYLTGDALARPHTLLRADSSSDGDPVRMGYSSKSLHLFPKQFFVTPRNYGLHMYAAAAAVLFFAARRWRSLFLPLAWVVWFIGYTWLGSLSPTSYVKLSQFDRYLAVVSVPLVVLIAAWLAGWSPKWRTAAYTLLAAAGLFMAGSGLADSEDTWAVRAAVMELEKRGDARPLYANIRSDTAVRFFYAFRPNREILPYGKKSNDPGPPEDLAAVRDAYILVDHNRIRAALARRPDERYPKEIDDPPDHWQEVLVVNNPAPAVSYLQLRALRALTRLPGLPDRLTKKVAGTIDATLADRDLVLYYAGDPNGRPN